MLYYNIYNNINDDDFLEIKKRMVLIEDKMFDKLNPSGWKFSTPTDKSDALIIDFIKEEKLFMGNIGIKYDDNRDKYSFSLFVTKSYDEKNKRYFLKNSVYENKELSFYEENIGSIVGVALVLYSHWGKNDIYMNGVTIDLR